MPKLKKGASKRKMEAIKKKREEGKRMRTKYVDKDGVYR